MSWWASHALVLGSLVRASWQRAYVVSASTVERLARRALCSLSSGLGHKLLSMMARLALRSIAETSKHNACLHMDEQTGLRGSVGFSPSGSTCGTREARLISALTQAARNLTCTDVLLEMEVLLSCRSRRDKFPPTSCARLCPWRNNARKELCEPQ